MKLFQIGLTLLLMLSLGVQCAQAQDATKLPSEVTQSDDSPLPALAPRRTTIATPAPEPVRVAPSVAVASAPMTSGNPLGASCPCQCAHHSDSTPSISHASTTGGSQKVSKTEKLARGLGCFVKGVGKVTYTVAMATADVAGTFASNYAAGARYRQSGMSGSTYSHVSNYPNIPSMQPAAIPPMMPVQPIQPMYWSTQPIIVNGGI